jgi:hypothetical protein
MQAMRNGNLIALMLLGAIFGAKALLSHQAPRANPARLASAEMPQPSLEPSLEPSPERRAIPAYVRPRVADNGSPFPSKSGYIDKYPQKFTDGYSSVTIDNSKNDSDLFVKLFSLEGSSPVPASAFLIRARDSFTVKEVRAGKYDVRYRNLDSGALSRTDSFNLKEVQIEGGVEFSRLTLTLYKVSHGNMQTHAISESEF